MKISEKLFFCAYGLYLFFCLLNASFYAIYINKLIKPIMILCSTIEILRECFCVKLSRKELIFMFLCILLSILLFLNMNGIAMLPVFIFIYGARTIEFKKIAKFTIKISSIVLIFVIISAKLGIITDYISTLDSRKRDFLGFRYALFPQMILFNITLADLYVNKEKLTIKRCLVHIIINYIMFKYTGSRLSFYLSLLIVIFLYLICKKPSILIKRKVICILLVFSFPILCISSVYITYKYDYSNHILRNMDEFLGGRLHLGKASLSEYKINLFGNDTKYIGAGLNMYGKKYIGKYNYVDCMYINLLEKYGILFNIIFIGLLTYLSYKAWKEKNSILLVILFGLAVHGVIDDLEIYLYYNVFLLSISKYFNKNSINKKTSETRRGYKKDVLLYNDNINEV